MMNLDVMIISFIQGNVLTIMLVMGLLKVIAKVTPWAWDDSIVSLLSGLVESVRGGPTVRQPDSKGE